MAGDIDVNNHNHNRGEVRESEAAVIVAKNGGEQCCGSDVVGPTEVLPPKSNGNMDDVDGSYVFVTSHDDGDDLVESDLNNGNNKTVEEFQVQEKNNGSCETEASGSLADEFNSPQPQIVDAGLVQGGEEEIHKSDVVVKNSDQLGFAEDVEKNEESEIGVESTDDNSNNNNDVVNDGTNRNPDVVLKNSDELGLAEDVVKDEESEVGVETDNNDYSNVVNNDTDQEVKKAGESLGQTPLEGSRDDLKQEDPPTVPSSHESEVKLDTVIEETSIFNNIGGGSSDVHEKDHEASQNLDVHGNQNGSSERVENVSSSCEIGDGLTDVHGSDDFSPSFEDVHENQAEQNAEIRQQSSLTALDSEKLLSFSKVEGSKEHNLEAASSSEADKTLETEVAYDLLCEQSGYSSSAGFADESLIETAVVTEEIDPPTALDNDKLLSFSTTEGSKGDDGESLEEHCFETPLSSGVDKSTETEVANGPLLEHTGEDLPHGVAQESLSETAVVTEQNGSSENGKSLNTFSICSDVALESGQSLSSLPFKGIENMDDFCHVETKKCLNMNDPESNCTANRVTSNPESCSASNGGEEKISADAIDVESVISNTSLECGADQHMSITNIEVEPEVDDGIAPNNKACGIAADGDLNYLKAPCQEAEGIKGKHVNSVSKSSQANLEGQNVKIGESPKDEEASTSLLENTSAGQNVGVEVVQRPLYLIKIPTFDDGNLREEIKHTELQVVARTKRRDAINIEVQKQRAIVKEYEYKAEASLKIEKDVRESIKPKRKDVESLQLEIDKVKNAQSVKDIQAEIHSMEHMIGHETLPLKEEKQLIHEINRLKQLRQKLSSNMGKQDEFQQALDQKDQNEEQLKALKKKIGSLRECLTKAEEVTKTDKKAQTFEIQKLNELISQFRDANDNRQQAYAHLQSLKKQLHERHKYFWRYKHLKAAQQSSKDKKELQRQCNEQVETIMKLWNRNDDFRKEYMRYNTRSTLRRLRTLDGRSLGPDEEPPVIPDIVIENNIRSTKDNVVSLTEIQEQEKQKVLPARAEKLDDKASAKVVEGKNQTANIKKPAKLAASSLGSEAVTILGEDERKGEAREREEEEQPRRSKEKEELARKAEESRKEEEEAKLTQQRKLEEKAKAREAMERKKRIAEKAQARAAVRAQKEAEEKEKEREKRARKKERKKATNGVETKNEDEGECAPTASSEIPSNGAQPESEKHATKMKRPHKTQQFSKQGRTRSLAVSPPLRNRGKRRMQPWMWATLAVAIVFASFLCWPSCMQWFGF